ncbi:FAD-dependent oxidoreductase [Amycolatopsis rhabdoformis]|uniref:FAD-dependent oxidoreductase n=1 Tax=Amycolatopsis rhabdoformis TaxID=1448059 RepID=A0ABZ1HXV4_9PSEU|nr:FAD-dependent oxidoreductase [Amycolatopsis rhabdoformis]WSE26971.1 FAD-dependent oxidoreductase [Amycolatopsis rhabdoformis]
MAARPRVVVIGAGVVGCALADELTERGWTDVTVLDQGPLFTGDGPGLVRQTDADRTMTEFAKYTVAKYGALTLAGRWCFQPVGGLELATTAQELAQLHRRRGWATSWGVRAYLRSPRECAELHALLDPAKVLGGLHTPGDGVAKPRRAAEAQARRAIDRGARFVAGQRVVAVDRAGGRVTGVVTETDRFRADVVVSCTGVDAPAIGRLVDLSVPLVPLAHRYARTTALPALAGDNDDFTEAGKPVLRHGELTVREHVDRLGIGHSTGHGSEPFVPADFDRPWAEAVRLLPALADAKVEDGVTNLVPATPDGRPLLGEHPDLDGFWVAEAVAFAHSAGAAREVARWLVDGQPRLDLRASDLARFERVQLAPDHVRERAIRTFAGPRPDEPRRPLRTSPFYERHLALGAHFSEAAGWERPEWFRANESLPEISRIPASSGARTAGAEAIVARERVAVVDLTPAPRLEITGPGALPFLQTMTTNQLDGPAGAVTPGLLLGEHGGVRGDVVVTRLGATRFQVRVSTAVDHAWLRRHLPGDGAVQIHEITSGTCCLGLCGPRAADVLRALSTVDLTGELARQTYLAEVPALVQPLTDLGEAGWELHTGADLGRRLWDAVWEAGAPHGIVAAGTLAAHSLRLEAGLRSCGADVTAEHDPFEAGLGAAVCLDKGYFLGRDALLGRPGATAGRELTYLVTDVLVLGKEPVYFAGHPAGYVTSAARGHTVGKNLAYAWLPVECAKPGTPVEIEYFGERVPAVVAAAPARPSGPRSTA